jgi:membrane-associated phospholipid phosphatase
MGARARVMQARVLPKGWLDLLRQVSLFVSAFLVYDLVRGFVEGRGTAAFANARELITIERTLHLFVEPSVQTWASGSHVLMVGASWLYVNAQTSITIGALLYLYLRHNRSFYFVRNMLIVAMAIALLGYIVFPTAPPRFLPEWGFTDTVSDITGVRATSAGVDTFFNPYAAVPSMHVAFALMIGWPLAKLVRWRVARGFWALYPLLITFVIVATANHFIFDAVLGALTAGIAAYVADRLARRRPEAWRFEPQPAVAAQTT